MALISWSALSHRRRVGKPKLWRLLESGRWVFLVPCVFWMLNKFASSAPCVHWRWLAAGHLRLCCLACMLWEGVLLHPKQNKENLCKKAAFYLFVVRKPKTGALWLCACVMFLHNLFVAHFYILCIYYITVHLVLFIKMALNILFKISCLTQVSRCLAYLFLSSKKIKK